MFAVRAVARRIPFIGRRYYSDEIEHVRIGQEYLQKVMKDIHELRTLHQNNEISSREFEERVHDAVTRARKEAIEASQNLKQKPPEKRISDDDYDLY